MMIPEVLSAFPLEHILSTGQPLEYHWTAPLGVNFHISSLTCFFLVTATTNSGGRASLMVWPNV